MKPANSLFLPALFAACGALLLLACTPDVDADMPGLRDLKHWQAAARNAATHNDASQTQAQAQTQAQVEHLDTNNTNNTNNANNANSANSKKSTSTRIAAMRDPFAPTPSHIDTAHPSGPAGATSASPALAEESLVLHLLGTVHNDGTAYALIEAGKQVHCVALKGALPSYPITVIRIADQAIDIDRLLPDGSHRHSTLRQGE